MLRTTSVISKPGGNHNQGMLSSTVDDCALVNMLPHAGIATRTPMPRKLSQASLRMVPATAKAPATTMGAVTSGRMWRNVMRPPDAPRQRLAMTSQYVHLAAQHLAVINERVSPMDKVKIKPLNRPYRKAAK